MKLLVIVELSSIFPVSFGLQTRIFFSHDNELGRFHRSVITLGLGKDPKVVDQ